MADGRAASCLSFLLMPAEIRLQVYAILLIHDHPFQVSSFAAFIDNRSICQSQALEIHPSILLACRQTYFEGNPILYGGNVFLASPSLLKGIVAAPSGRITSAPLISHMRRFHLCIRLDCDPRYGSQELENAFNGAEELNIEVFQASFGMGDTKLLDMFRGIRGVKKAKVWGSISRELADDLAREMGKMAGAPGDDTADDPYRGYEVWLQGR